MSIYGKMAMTLIVDTTKARIQYKMIRMWMRNSLLNQEYQQNTSNILSPCMKSQT